MKELLENNNRVPDNYKVKCDECNWSGIIGQCITEMESAGWEYPEYEVLLCPKCGEHIDI